MGSPGIQSLLVMSVLLATGFCQQQRLVEPNPVAANQPFTVTCEANRVPAVPSRFTIIYLLAIFRNVSTNFTKVAVYAISRPPESPNIDLTQKFIPPGRRWTITSSGSTDAGGSPVGNRDTMKVVLVVSDTRLEDAGIYRCRVDYYPPGDITPTTGDNYVKLTVTAPAKAGPSVVMIIVGIVIGCVVLIAIIICVLRHKRSKLKQSRSSEKVRQTSKVRQEPIKGQDGNNDGRTRLSWFQ